MKKIATWTALALATTLAGCTGAANGNRGLESVHQPVVRNTIYQFDVAAGSGDIAPSEQGRLQGWLDALNEDLEVSPLDLYFGNPAVDYGAATY